MLRKLFSVAALAGVIVVAGCSQRLGDLTLVSSKNIELSKFDTFQRDNNRATGIDQKPVILFPVGYPSLEEAIDQAIESVPGGVALVDATLAFEFFSFIVGYNKYIVEGEVLIDPERRAKIERGEEVEPLERGELIVKNAQGEEIDLASLLRAPEQK